MIWKTVVEANVGMLLSQQNIKEILAKDGVEFEKPLLRALRSTMEKIKIKQLTEQVWNEIFQNIGCCYPE